MSLTKANNRMIDGAPFHVEDYGAVGDGVADDTAAFAAAFTAASGTWVVGDPSAEYRITSTINMNQDRFDGRGCLITKDFGGIAVIISGGAAFSWLWNCDIVPSVAFQATDHTTNNHNGIFVENTRFDIRGVSCNNHDGVGIFARNTAPNMNTSVLLDFTANANAYAGILLDGDDPGGADDMSVWRVQCTLKSNFGWGLLTTPECPIRDSVMHIYAENNLIGAAIVGMGHHAVDFNRADRLDIWTYTETATDNEFRLGADAANCRVFSVRKNKDADDGTNNTFVFGARQYNPSGQNRMNTPLVLEGSLSRTSENGEYVQAQFIGSSGTGIFGYLRGEGNTDIGNQWMKLVSQSEVNSIGVNDQLASTEKMFLSGSTVPSGNMTVGFGVDGKGAFGEIFTVQDSVNAPNPMTTIADAATVGYMRQRDSNGGLYLRGLSGGSIGLQIETFAAVGVASDTVNSSSAMHLVSYFADGTGLQDFLANDNIFTVRNNASTRMLLKGNGGLHITNPTPFALDERDDALTIRALDNGVVPGKIDTEWDRFVEKNDDALKEIGVLSSTGDFIIVQPMFKLLNGAVWQGRAMFETMRKVIAQHDPALGELITEALRANRLPALV